MDISMKELKKELETVSSALFDFARSVREREMEMSARFYFASEICKKAAESLRSDPEEIEIEGGGHSWWHVCGGCHGNVDIQDKYCKHCGSELKKGK